jgi:L-2-hydroxyglutarate oxidase LhgO
MEASSHNSGVIHAGLYYPPGSLKARLCVSGRDALYAFCDRYDVPYRRCGKLVIADDPGRAGELEALASNARENGVRVELVPPRKAQTLAPFVTPKAALWSPDTGIVDASMLVHALAARAKAEGAILLYNTTVVAAEPRSGAIILDTGRERVRARTVVNAAGLRAGEVSRCLAGEPIEIQPCRGDYAEIVGNAARAVAMPVYPLPDRSGHGLGVHLTPTTGGSVLVGPTIRLQDSATDLETGRPSREEFLAAARRLMPSLTPQDLRDGQSGIRAMLRPLSRFRDFAIRRDERQPHLVLAVGIDSPGLTSCLAIGAAVADLVEGRAASGAIERGVA